MAEIYVPDTSKKKEEFEEKTIEVTYNPEPEDEEKFIMIAAMGLQPSEVGFDATDPEKRRWLMARFMQQREMEREAIMQQQIAAGLDPRKLRT
jgi:hypothetical protein